MARALNLDDVLEAFALEPNQSYDVLMNYVRRYPAFAATLVEYARELSLAEEADRQDHEPDEAWLGESWNHFTKATSGTEAAVTDPFLGMTSARWAEIRKALGLPSSVLNAFRDRVVDIDTVPDWIIDRFAALLNVANDNFRTFETLPRRTASGVQYKSDAAPSSSSEKIGFEVLLEQALLSPEERERLMQGPA